MMTQGFFSNPASLYAIGSIVSQGTEAVAGYFSGQQSGKSFGKQVGSSTLNMASSILQYTAIGQLKNLGGPIAFLGGRLAIANPVVAGLVAVGVPIGLSIATNVLNKKVFGDDETTTTGKNNNAVSRKELTQLQQQVKRIQYKQNLK